MRTVVNGRAIEHYKDFDVRETGLAVPREPKYKQAISNGYAPNDFVVDNSLVLCLPLHALKGSTFKSVDRYEHTSTVTGAIYGATGRTFDGNDDYIDCGRATSLDLVFGFTLEAWVKTSTTEGAAAIVTKGESNSVTESNYFFELYSNHCVRIGFNDGLGGYRRFATTATVGTDWTYIVAVVVACDDMRVYVNGSAEAGSYAGAATAIQTRPTKELRIGKGETYQFSGTIDEVRIYNRALSAAEILHNYNATRWRYQ